MAGLTTCPICKRLSLRSDGMCLNPEHPRGKAAPPGPASPPSPRMATRMQTHSPSGAAPATGQWPPPPAATAWPPTPPTGEWHATPTPGTRPPQTPQDAGFDLDRPLRRHQPQDVEELLEDEEEEESGGGINAKTIGVVVGIVLLAALVLYGSAMVRARFLGGNDAPATSAASTQASVNAMPPRPGTCDPASLWGYRKAPNGQQLTSCTSTDGNKVRFYDLTMASLGATKSTDTLKCGTDGKDGATPYVDCTRIPPQARKK